MTNTKLDTLMTKIAELTEQANAIRNSELTSVIEDIKTKMNDYGIDITDLQFGSPSETNAEGERTIHRRRKPDTKYMDAATGKSWTGRGKLPVWMKEAISQGKTKEDFLVEGIFAGEKEAEAKPELQVTADGKLIRTRRKPEAKYMDAETGKAWSGRGKTPTWLKAALNEGKTMEQFAVA